MSTPHSEKNRNSSDHEEEIMVLDHEEVPGYRPVFLVAITLGILYLAFVFYRTL